MTCAGFRWTLPKEPMTEKDVRVSVLAFCTVSGYTQGTMSMKNPAAVALGRLGGSVSSPKKYRATLKSLKKARKVQAEKRRKAAA
jgi:hypothetical protein